jgi:hypothetical protein
MPVPAHGITEAKVLPQFDKDIRDLHLIYDYDAHDSNGKPEKWRYEMYCISQSIFISYAGCGKQLLMIEMQVVLLRKKNRV